jgi:hypothetical protein
MTQNRKKAVLTVQEKVECIEKFENGELTTELAKDYRAGIERF